MDGSDTAVRTLACGGCSVCCTVAEHFSEVETATTATSNPFPHQIRYNIGLCQYAEASARGHGEKEVGGRPTVGLESMLLSARQG